MQCLDFPTHNLCMQQLYIFNCVEASPCHHSCSTHAANTTHCAHRSCSHFACIRTQLFKKRSFCACLLQPAPLPWHDIRHISWYVIIFCLLSNFKAHLYLILYTCFLWFPAVSNTLIAATPSSLSVLFCFFVLIFI